MNKKCQKSLYEKNISLLLKEARTKKGYKIQDVAEILNIKEEFLKALETGQLGKLPHQTYTLGFVRSYAQFLDLDPFLTLDAFKKEYHIQTKESLEVPSGEELRLISASPKLITPTVFYQSHKAIMISIIVVVLFLVYRIMTSPLPIQ